MNKKQTLYLLRHAEAEPWFPGVHDLERSLSKAGTRHMEKLAEWASSNLEPPERVLCSPSVRTRETLAPLVAGWIGGQADIRFEPDVYEATTGCLQSLVEAGLLSCNRLMLVGHNPGLEYLFQSIGRPESDDRVEKMATGSLAVIEFDGGWVESAGGGRIACWISRSQFD